MDIINKAIIVLIYCFLVMVLQASFAQDAPVTNASTVGNVSPGSISIPVTVTGFNNIGAISLSIDYDYSVMHFISGTPNPSLPVFPSGDMDLGTGFHRITMGWFGTATTLANGSTIITLNFSFIGGITALNWYDNGPSCEYADGNSNILNDTPTGTFYLNGNVCGIIGNPGTIEGTDSLCQGTWGVQYIVTPVVNATGYNWSVPGGATILTGQNSNAVMVNFSDSAVSGIISVSPENYCGTGTETFLPVTVSPLPYANAGNDTTVNYGTSTTLHAQSGGSGTYSYSWSPGEMLVDPNVQDPQTVILSSTIIFTVQVINMLTLCQDEDQIIVSLSGGPLSINPVAIPDLVCSGGSSQLYSNVSGGSENYSYLWTCIPPGSPPWGSDEANPVVSPDSSRQYLLSVNDGYNILNDWAYLWVAQLPTATISGGDTLCGEDKITTLQVDLTGTPPWSFTYSYGSTSVFINNQLETPFFIIASDPGDYVITAVENEFCNGTSFGGAIVRKYPIPATPEITVNGDELISSSCCGNHWYRDGQILPGAVGQTYMVTENGQYFVVVTLNSCTSEPSDPVDMTVGVKEFSDDTFSIYPNPATTALTISDSDLFKSISHLSIFSLTGIKHKELMLTHGNGAETIDLKNIPPGFYIILITGPGIHKTGQLIIR